MELWSSFVQSQAGLALYGALSVAFIDFAFGVLAAVRDKTLKWDVIATFIQSHIIERVFPIGLMLVFGFVANDGGDGVGAPLLAAGLTMEAAYVAETIGSILASWGPNHGVQAVPE